MRDALERPESRRFGAVSAGFGWCSSGFGVAGSSGGSRKRPARGAWRLRVGTKRWESRLEVQEGGETLFVCWFSSAFQQFRGVLTALSLLPRLATLSLELQASQSRGHQLENQLARQLRELDPTLGPTSQPLFGCFSGSDHRGVSVQHLSNALVELVFAAGLTLEASIDLGTFKMKGLDT